MAYNRTKTPQTAADTTPQGYLELVFRWALVHDLHHSRASASPSATVRATFISVPPKARLDRVQTSRRLVVDSHFFPLLLLSRTALWWSILLHLLFLVGYLSQASITANLKRPHLSEGLFQTVWPRVLFTRYNTAHRCPSNMDTYLSSFQPPSPPAQHALNTVGGNR